MRGHISLATLVLLPALSLPVWAYSPDEKTPDQETIAALQAKISQAPPKDQCFLYAELIHQMTEVSLREYSAGNVEKANDLLKQVQLIAHRVHLSLADDNKRLKNAEILLRHTAFRLNEMLHASNYEDRPLLEQTLAQVNKADSEAMMQVFKK
ncbi:MAG TPA: hypothetical protein VL967_11115 [Terracidiphilus sp.]|nr:hypothetical protein [Terracidiphilus sp.]